MSAKGKIESLHMIRLSSHNFYEQGITVRTDGNFVFEEIMNSVSHGVAFLASIVGSIVLLRDVADDTNFTDYHFWACFLYSFSLMFLFISSCLYHSFFMLPTPSRVLQVLDHTGIYYLIAGSYTPFLLIALHHDTSSRILLTSLWIAAFFGTIFSSKFYRISIFYTNSSTILSYSILRLQFQVYNTRRVDDIPRNGIGRCFHLGSNCAMFELSSIGVTYPRRCCLHLWHHFLHTRCKEADLPYGLALVCCLRRSAALV
jgi:channel protein (hemolysin III family)